MSQRVETATQVLYKAFNEGTLNAFNCKACAVGNMITQDGFFDEHEYRIWHMHTICYDYNEIEYEIEYEEDLNYLPTHSQFSTDELAKIEKRFLEAWQDEEKLHKDYAHDRTIQFKGLMNVLDYLYHLDGIETPSEVYNDFLDVLNEEEKLELQ